MSFTMKGTQVLKKYPSMSDPNKFYEIRLGKDDVTYCTCWAWIKNKHCKHLDNYLSSLSGEHFQKIIQDGYELYQIIDEEIKKLKG